MCYFTCIAIFFTSFCGAHWENSFTILINEHETTFVRGKCTVAHTIRDSNFSRVKLALLVARINNAACTLYNFFLPLPPDGAGPQGKQAVR